MIETEQKIDLTNGLRKTESIHRMTKFHLCVENMAMADIEIEDIANKIHKLIGNSELSVLTIQNCIDIKFKKDLLFGI